MHGNVKDFLARPENKTLSDAVQPLFEAFAKVGEEGFENALKNNKGVSAVFSDIFKTHLKQTAVAKWVRNFMAQASKLWTRNKVKSIIDTHEIARNIKDATKNAKIKELLASSDSEQKLIKFTDELLGDAPQSVKDQFIEALKNGTQEIEKIKDKIDTMSVSEIRKTLDQFINKIEEKLGTNIAYKNYKTLFNTAIAGGVPILAIILGVPYAFNAWLTNIQKKAGKIGIMKAMETIDDARVFAPEQVPETKKEEKSVETASANSNLLKQIKQ